MALIGMLKRIGRLGLWSRGNGGEMLSERFIGQGEGLDQIQGKQRRNPEMNLAIWLPAMFLLGLVLMGLFYLFMEACDKI